MNSLLMEDEQDEATKVPAGITVPRKYRVQLDFAPKDFHEIESLVGELGLSTRAELFRSAIVALRWMVQKKRTGCTIMAVTPDDRLLEPEFEFLQGIQPIEPAAPKKSTL